MTPDDTLHNTLPFFLWETYTPQLEQDLGLPLDSLFPSWTQQEPLLRESILQPSELAITHDEVVARTMPTTPAWLFGLLIAISALLCIYYQVRKINLKDLFLSLIDHRAMDRMIRGANLTTMRLFACGMFAATVLATAIYPITNYSISWPTLTLFLMIAYIVRWLLLRLLGRIYQDKNAIKIYIVNGYLFHLAYATIVCPMLFLQVYMPWGNDTITSAILIATAACFFFRFCRGIRLFLTHLNGRYINLFYYLCIVETAPLLLVAKWFLVQ